MAKKPTLTIPAADKPSRSRAKPPESLKAHLATFIDANDGITGVKIIPAHVESYAQYGDLTRIDMTSGKTWYIDAPVSVIDTMIKCWYLQEEIEISNTPIPRHPGSL
jgi:hypothetical protein